MVSHKKEKGFTSVFYVSFFLGYTAALMEREGFDVKVVDGVPLNLSDEEFIDRCCAVAPNIVLFEPATIDFKKICEVSNILFKRIPVRIVFAGPHVTFFSKDILAQEEYVEFALIGEYEKTFLGLAKRIRDGKEYTDIKGISYRNKNNVIVVGERATPIEPLDFLPPPARHLFPAYFDNRLGLYHDGFCQHRPAIQLHSSRGCGLKCNYCLWNQTLFSQCGQRRFSPKRFVQEMLYVIKKYGAREIYIDDDDFTQDRNHVYSICDEIERTGLQIPWSVMGDVYNIDFEILSKMARAGCIGMKFGLENAVPDLLKGIRKPVDLQIVEKWKV